MKGIRGKDGKTTMIRVYPSDKEKLKDLKLQLENIQKTELGVAEVIKRTLNVPDLPTVLKIDAEAKRRLGLR